MAKKKKKQQEGGEMARKIWLAGIGAYGRAFSDAQESIARMGDETTKLFEDLVERGEAIEDKVENQSREIAKRVRAPKMPMEDRIQEMRDRLKLGGFNDGDGGERMDEIEDRLAVIEAKLDQLLAAKPAPAKKRAPVKRKATRKKKATG